MRDHRLIDQRSLALARAVVAKIDADPERRALQRARERCLRWERSSPSPAKREWLELLERPWEEIRAILLDESDEGARLRQNAPFAGELEPAERFDIYRRYTERDQS